MRSLDDPVEVDPISLGHLRTGDVGIGEREDPQGGRLQRGGMGSNDRYVLGQGHHPRCSDLGDPPVIADPLVLTAGIEIGHKHHVEPRILEDGGDMDLAEAAVDEEPQWFSFTPPWT
jgi:hypothetical protein